MNAKSPDTDGRLPSAPRLTRLSDGELTLIVGGSIWSKIKSAARWVKDHVFVDTGNGKKIIGIKG